MNNSLDSARFVERAREVGERLDVDSAQRLFNQAAQARNERQRVVWLYRALDKVGEAAQAAGVSPCREGCSHCCRIPVLISAAEAREIGRVTGRKPSAAPAGVVQCAPDETLPAFLERLSSQREALVDAAKGSPCPFLVNDRCSAHASRPVACRLQISLSDSSEPCDVGSDGSRHAEVAYLNTIREHALAVGVLGQRQPFADIRAFFPD